MGPFPTDRELAVLFFEKTNRVDLTGRPVIAFLYLLYQVSLNETHTQGIPKARGI